jgi:hypothetical protein
MRAVQFLGRPRGTWVLSLAVFIGLALAPGVQQQPEDSRYFPETGHTVKDRFLEFFDGHGGLEILGFPITDEFYDSEAGLTVQYFQGGRLEYHPDNPEPYTVQLGLLGAQILAEREPVLRVGRAEAANNPNCQFFPETSHNVCYSFRVFYNAHGGLDVFGYPLTEIIQENNRFVQYFQRARMEWHPERPPGQKVQLGRLGRIYYDLAGLDRRYLPAPSATLREITSLTVHASVEVPITGQGTAQTVFVYVIDQQGLPVSDAQVTVIAHWPAGDETFHLAATDARGMTSVPFHIGPTTPGTMILLDVTAVAGPIAGATRTSFLPWW